MAHKYPRLGRVIPHKKNDCARCSCGEIGKYKIDIQWSYMRGEDSTVWSCENHKRDSLFLIGNYDCV